MSSTTAGGSAAPGPSEPRKKFGKNLNKLTKPPPPPPVSSTARVPGSSRNGLLVLSTKRSASGSGASSNLLSKMSGGGAPRTLSTPSLKSETPADGSSKVGDGAGGSGGLSQQQQVWKVEEKPAVSPLIEGNISPGTSENFHQQKPVAAQQQQPLLAPRGNISTGRTYFSKSGSAPRWSDVDDAEDGRAEIVPPPIGAFSSHSEIVAPFRQNFDRGYQPSRSGLRNNGAPVPYGMDRDQNNFSRGYLDEGLHRQSFDQPSRHENNNSVYEPARKDDYTRQNERRLQAEKTLSGSFIVKPQASAPSEPEQDEQAQYMARLAKERAEGRREEEQRRSHEQKARATQRLKELEQKIQNIHTSSGNLATTSTPISSAVDSSAESASRSANDAQKTTSLARSVSPNSEIVLERLGRPKDSAVGAIRNVRSTNGQHQTHSSNERTLFDPYRTYSSLVGGGAPKCSKTQSGAESGGGNEVAGQNQTETSLKHDKQERTKNCLDSVHRHHDEHIPPISVIQLTGYDDQDREGRGRNAGGPRMLFDPKSGSMVEAPSSEKRSAYHSSEDGNGASKSRRERRTKNGDRERLEKTSGRKIDANSVLLIKKKRSDSDATHSVDSSTLSRGAEVLTHGVEASHLLKKNNAKEESGVRQRREKRRLDTKKKSGLADSAESGFIYGIAGDKGKASEKGTRTSKRGTPSKGTRTPFDDTNMPRTCGVLYKRDDNNLLLCADACDGDQGYGLHSVPGGKVRNPAAFKRLTQQHKSSDHIAPDRGTGRGSRKLPLKDALTPAFVSAFERSMQMRPELVEQRDMHLRQAETDFKLGFNMTRLNTRSNSEGDVSVPSNLLGRNKDAGFYLPAVPIVTAKDSLTLLSDGPDSPTLQASAMPWRPSEAALAAAAAVINGEELPNSKAETTRDDSAQEEGSDSESAHSLFGGLGFDPTQNMDLVMMSPSLRSEAGDDDEYADHIPPLSLDDVGTDALKVPFSALNSPGRFLSSSTWGTGSVMNAGPSAPLSIGLSWNLLGSQNDDGKNGLKKAGNGSHQLGSSFLSLSPLAASKSDGGSGWGSGPFSGGHLGGFGGAAFGSTTGNQKMGDNGD